MVKPHKHADLIKAWADGAEIEFFSEYRQYWIATDRPRWAENTKYRTKPEPRELHYRVALCKTTSADGSLMLRFPTSYDEASSLELASCFVRWMSNWNSFGSVQNIQRFFHDC